jgi:diaminopimelate dehydrogenase
MKVTIIGYGNVGRGVHRALKNNPDMELVQIITRDPPRVKRQVSNVLISSVDNFDENADVAILCGGSCVDIFGSETKKELIEQAPDLEDTTTLGQGPYFAQFFNTVDSFDTHARLPDYFRCMDKYLQKSKHTSIIAAGWDPGTFSLQRAFASAFFPFAKHYTFWGPGVSQGHSDAVRCIKGVKDACQYTLPVQDVVDRVRIGENPDLKTGEKHTRLVYVVLEPDANKEAIERTIKTMPDYFVDYETKVKFISEQELLNKHNANPHSGFVLASGYTNNNNRALVEYKCEWGDNSEATACILVACARACCRLNNEQRHGAFTMFDIPPSYYGRASREELLREYL